MSMNIGQGTSATAFMAKEIHMAFCSSRCSVRMVVPQAIMVGQRDALEAGVGEGVEDGLGDVGKAGRW